MAGLYDVLIPAAGTNLIKNPSFERASAVWKKVFGAGASEATYTAGGYMGAQHMFIDTPGFSDIRLYQLVPLTSGVEYTFSFYSRNYVTNAGNQIGIFAGDVTTFITAITPNSSSDWTRSSVTYSATATADFAFEFFLDDNAGDATSIHVDAIQVEASSSATAYIDGDQPGCTWNGPAHVSTSSRITTARGAGTWTDLQDLGVYVTSQNGLGIGDQDITMSEYALRDGGEVRQTRTPSRNFSLAFTIVGTSQSDLHTKRQTFTNYLYARRYGSSQPVYLRYRGAASNVVVECWYEGGLSYSHAGGDGFAERTAARFILEEATLETETRKEFVLTTAAAIGSAAEYNFIQRVNGAWGVAGTGVSAPINAMKFSPQGLLYMGGDFITASTSALAVNYAAMYDGDTYSIIGSTGFSAAVNSIEITPGGAGYMGGAYITVDAGATEMRRIAAFAEDSSFPKTALTALGAGFSDGVVYAMVYESTGSVYAAGSHTSDSDSKALTRVAKFDGDTWATVAAGFSDGIVYAMVKGADSKIYTAGTMTTDTDAGAFPNHLASYTVGDTAWLALGPELTDTSAKTFRALAATPGGKNYAGGYYDSLANGILVGIDNSSVTLISDTIAPIYAMTYDTPTGLLYIAHGGASAGVSVYNGTDIRALDVISGGTSIYNAIAVSGETIYVGGDIDEALSAGAVNTVTVAGSGSVQPRLYLLAGTLKYMRNITTGKVIYFNMACNYGETITIDFATGLITSSFGRNLYGDILGGDFSTFELISGDNSIDCFMTGSGSAVLAWIEQEIGL